RHRAAAVAAARHPAAVAAARHPAAVAARPGTAAATRDDVGGKGQDRQRNADSQLRESAIHVGDPRCGEFLVGDVRRPYLPASGGLRTIVNSSIPGTAAPPMVRSTDFQLARSLPRRVMTFVAEACWPSCRTPSALMTHSFPLRVQYPSPNPPWES